MIFFKGGIKKVFKKLSFCVPYGHDHTIVYQTEAFAEGTATSHLSFQNLTGSILSAVVF